MLTRPARGTGADPAAAPSPLDLQHPQHPSGAQGTESCHPLPALAEQGCQRGCCRPQPSKDGSPTATTRTPQLPTCIPPPVGPRGWRRGEGRQRQAGTGRTHRGALGRVVPGCWVIAHGLSRPERVLGRGETEGGTGRDSGAGPGAAAAAAPARPLPGTAVRSCREGPGGRDRDGEMEGGTGMEG